MNDFDEMPPAPPALERENALDGTFTEPTTELSGGGRRRHRSRRHRAGLSCKKRSMCRAISRARAKARSMSRKKGKGKGKGKARYGGKSRRTRRHRK